MKTSTLSCPSKQNASCFNKLFLNPSFKPQLLCVQEKSMQNENAKQSILSN